MISERYRKDYTGEFIIVETSWSGGKKRTKREWIPSQIENHHISGRAACIGSAVDLEHFNFTILQNHKGGLLGSKKLQTYGVSDITNSMRLDFAVEKEEVELIKLLNTHYYKENVIFTTPRQCLKYPGSFYVIPYNPPVCKEVALPYLAAFDGHTEVFLLGYTDDAAIGQSDWKEQLAKVISAYPSTQFYHVVHNDTLTPDTWKNYNNVTSMKFTEFITHCDV